MDKCSQKVIQKRLLKKKNTQNIKVYIYSPFFFTPLLLLLSCCVSSSSLSQPLLGQPTSPCRVLHTWWDVQRRCSRLNRLREHSQPPWIRSSWRNAGPDSSVWATRRLSAAATSDTHSAASQTAFSPTRQVVEGSDCLLDETLESCFVQNNSCIFLSE